jgi:hypothetical protein
LDFPSLSLYKNKNSARIKKEIIELEEYFYKNHEVLLEKRDELIHILEQERALEDLSRVIQEQIQGLKEIFQDRLSVEIAYLEFKKWKCLEMIQGAVSREYTYDVYDKVVQVFGSDHEYSLDIKSQI